MKTIQNWEEHIENWQASGKSCMAYCKEHSLSYSSFRYNLKKSTKPPETSLKEYPFEELGFLDYEQKEENSEQSPLLSISVNQEGMIECKINLRFQVMIWDFS